MLYRTIEGVLNHTLPHEHRIVINFGHTAQAPVTCTLLSLSRGTTVLIFNPTSHCLAAPDPNLILDSVLRWGWRRQTADERVF